MSNNTPFQATLIWVLWSGLMITKYNHRGRKVIHISELYSKSEQKKGKDKGYHRFCGILRIIASDLLHKDFVPLLSEDWILKFQISSFSHFQC